VNWLQVGDKVLSVNGNNLLNADHYQAVEVLRHAGGSLTLMVLREVDRVIRVSYTLHLSLALCAGPSSFSFLLEYEPILTLK